VSDVLHSINQTLQELERLHQLNVELTEYLNTIMNWIIVNEIPVPSKEKLFSLLRKAEAIQKEIYGSKISDDFLQRKKSDKDLTEPKIAKFIY
jgi:hypothetical protein